MPDGAPPSSSSAPERADAAEIGNGDCREGSEAASGAGAGTGEGGSDAEEEGAEGDLQPHVDGVLGRMDLRSAMARSIRNCNLSVAIADPQLEDTPLVSVSDGFCELTGYSRETVVGRNCRFLNHGVQLKMADRMGLREASVTGRHFCALVENIKANGTRFLNLLDLRGLAVGRTSSQEERWFVVAVQADMTGDGTDDIPLDRKLEMQYIADMIRQELASALQEAAIVATESRGHAKMRGEVTPYPEPRWILGEVVELPLLGS